MWARYISALFLKHKTTVSVSCHVAAREIRPSEETPPGREKEAGRKEEVSGRWGQHIQTEKDCCRALAESSSAGRGLHHTQEGQREEKVSIVIPLCGFTLTGVPLAVWLQEMEYEMNLGGCWQASDKITDFKVLYQYVLELSYQYLSGLSATTG